MTARPDERVRSPNVVTVDDSSGLVALQAIPLAKDVGSALASYVATTGLTAARPGEEWTARPLPSTGARKDLRRLFTVNVSNMETLFGFYNPHTGQDLGGRLIVWHDLTNALPRLSAEYEIDELEPVTYKTAQGNAVAIDYLDHQELARFLADSEIAGAAARLVSFLRSNGQVPSIQRRWHDPSFAAWLNGAD